MSLLDLTAETAIQVRLSPDWNLCASADGALLLAKGPRGLELALAEYDPLFEEANRRLTAGAPLAALRDAASESVGMGAAIEWLVLLQDWRRRGLIEFPLVDDEIEVGTIVPQWADYVPALAADVPPPGRGLHRFACLRKDGGAWLLESPLCAAQLRLPNLAALERPLIRRALAACGYFDGENEESDAARRDALRQWEFHDLLFHVGHRAGWRREPAGAAFAFADSIEPQPAVRPVWPGEAIDLPRADDAGTGEPLARVAERRRSIRSYDEQRPIRLREIGALLDRCARVRETGVAAGQGEDGGAHSMEFAHRPYPSGGACYELEIYPVIDRCSGLESGAYHYDAGRHRLVRIAGRTAEVEQMISQAKTGAGGFADPQALLVISARFGRVMWKYRSLAYGLILRNTGVLYQALYLEATSLGLAPCALGTGDSALFARLTGLDPVVEGSVGEFMLGSRPS